MADCGAGTTAAGADDANRLNAETRSDHPPRRMVPEIANKQPATTNSRYETKSSALQTVPVEFLLLGNNVRGGFSVSHHARPRKGDWRFSQSGKPDWRHCRVVLGSRSNGELNLCRYPSRPRLRVAGRPTHHLRRDLVASILPTVPLPFCLVMQCRRHGRIRMAVIGTVGGPSSRES